jgi:hypothetical protein
MYLTGVSPNKIKGFASGKNSGPAGVKIWGFLLIFANDSLKKAEGQSYENERWPRRGAKIARKNSFLCLLCFLAAIVPSGQLPGCLEPSRVMQLLHFSAVRRTRIGVLTLINGLKEKETSGLLSLGHFRGNSGKENRALYANVSP